MHLFKISNWIYGALSAKWGTLLSYQIFETYFPIVKLEKQSEQLLETAKQAVEKAVGEGDEEPWFVNGARLIDKHTNHDTFIS